MLAKNEKQMKRVVNARPEIRAVCGLCVPKETHECFATKLSCHHMR